MATSSIAIAPDSPTDLIERANRAYRDGSVKRAITLYERADDLGADDPLTLYNWGTALTASDERGLAERMFRKADELAHSDELRANARFNLAQSLFVTASTLTEEDPRRAIELFDDSAMAAKGVLRISPGDTEAASHVEISHMAAQLVRDQLELAERLRELADRQRDQSRASQDAHQQQEGAEANQREDRQSQDPPEQPEQSPEQSDGQGESPQRRDLPSWLRGLLGPTQSADEGDEASERPDPSQRREPADEPERPEGDAPPGPTPPPPAQADQGPSEQDERSESAAPGAKPPDDSPADEGLGQAQDELSSETEGIARMLRRAIENDLVAGDRDFVEAVLRAIEEARDSQDDAKEDLDRERFDEAAGEQEQAASLLEMGEQMMNQARSRQPRDPQDSPPDETQEPQQGDQIADGQAQELLEKERREREMRRAFQRRIMRGRRAPARDW